MFIIWGIRRVGSVDVANVLYAGNVELEAVDCWSRRTPLEGGLWNTGRLEVDEGPLPAGNVVVVLNNMYISHLFIR